MLRKSLLACMALATGAAFAQAPNDTSRSSSAKSPAEKQQAATRAMGAAPADLRTDLQAPARRARIDQAYARWQSSRR